MALVCAVWVTNRPRSGRTSRAVTTMDSAAAASSTPAPTAQRSTSVGTQGSTHWLASAVSSQPTSTSRLTTMENGTPFKPMATT
jgi:hypothetical protein